ncbi:MAG TPA: competence/damage-inducible protein A [Polyangiaceae bacterium]|jgi:nicotinamide-nucleotide amidase
MNRETAAVLCIGTELTRGELLNGNATWLAEALTTIGFEVAALDCVADDRAAIERALTRLSAEHRILVCTGGLGPTTDDITTECVARVQGVPLERDPVSLERIRERMRRFGRTMAESNAKQADFPRGARIMPNENGTAPGFSINHTGCDSFFMPGVPAEMKAMFDAHVAPRVTPLVSTRHCQILLRTYGLPESELNDRLVGIEAEFGITVGYRATLPEVEVKVLARNRDAGQARSAARAAADAVLDRLGDEIVFGEGVTRLPEVACRLLEQHGLTLAIAESCTGGLVAELVTAHAGASAVFLGSAVTYANSAKTSILGVSNEILSEFGAVSGEVARAMAEAARQRFGGDLGLALTGIAGPTGGTPDKPVGLVYYAVADARETRVERRTFTGTREQIRRRAAYAGLALLRKVARESRSV